MILTLGVESRPICLSRNLSHVVRHSIAAAGAQQRIVSRTFVQAVGASIVGDAVVYGCANDVATCRPKSSSKMANTQIACALRLRRVGIRAEMQSCLRERGGVGIWLARVLQSEVYDQAAKPLQRGWQP